MRRKLRHSLLLLLIWMVCLQAGAFAQEPAPVMTGYGDGFLLFENGQGQILDAAGERTGFDVPNGAEICWCEAPDGTLYWQDMQGSVWRCREDEEAERLLRNMPPAAGIVCVDDAEQIVFSDGTVYGAGSGEKTLLPVESALIGAAVNEYMTVLAEQNGTLWIRKPGADFVRLRYGELYGVRVRLTDTAVWENTVYICGEREDGAPFLAGSVMGGVWIEREIAAPADNGTATVPEGIPLCMTAAEELEALVLGCSDGTVAVLPSCIKCTALYRLADTAVTDVAAAGGSLGYIADGEFHSISLSDIPQSENPEKDCPTGC